MQYYGNKDGNLYSASGKGAILEYLGPDKENYYYAYEKKSNKAANDYTDLQNLLFFISNSKDSDFSDSVDRYIDFAPFLQSVVTEMTVCKRDAFYDAGRNFYLNYDSSRFRFVYIPDDFDYSFSDEFSFNLNFLNDQSPHLGDVSSVITDRFLKSDKLRDLYYGKVCHLIQKSFDPANLIGYIDWLSALANTWDFDFDDFSMRTTDEIRNFVIKRKTLLESDLQSGSFSCKANALDEVVTKPTLPAVYPIPVMENLTIRFKEVNTKFGIALSDLNGRICLMDDNLYGSRIVSFHAMPPGVYSLKISTGSGVQCVKITKL